MASSGRRPSVGGTAGSETREQGGRRERGGDLRSRGRRGRETLAEKVVSSSCGRREAGRGEETEIRGWRVNHG